MSKLQYSKKLNQIAARYGNLEDDTIKRMLAMLKDLRRDIAAQMLTTKEFDTAHLRALRSSINALIDRWVRDLTPQVRAALGQAAEHGIGAVTEPLAELGLEIGAGQFHAPVAAQVNVALDFSADLIKEIAEDMRAKINRTLRQALLGTIKPLDAMKRITADLGIEARAKVWKGRPDPVKGVAARGEIVLRTELIRAFNVSHHSQQMALAKTTPGVLKSWQATADLRTRESHLIAHRTYRKNPIPIDEPFVLSPTKGKSKGRKFQLMYPLDPNGPPELTINCRCRMATHHPRVGVIGSSLDGRIEAELNRRAEARIWRVGWERRISD